MPAEYRSREWIANILKRIEEYNNVKILFAVENGSRAWGIESEDSDYDVRFVFNRPVKDYLRLVPFDTVLVRAEGNIDAVGFDIFKFVRLLCKSNPQTTEWLTSEILYTGYRPQELLDFLADIDLEDLRMHYTSMCKSNYLKYIKSNNDVTYKRYLYSLRGMLNAQYIDLYQRLPFTKITQTVEIMYTHSDICVTMANIIEMKKEGKEKERVIRLPMVDESIERFLKQTKTRREMLQPDISALQAYVWSVLGGFG